MQKFENVQLKKYYDNGIKLHEHETLLSFVNDGGNYAFNEWWIKEGAILFNKWCLNSDEFKCEATN